MLAVVKGLQVSSYMIPFKAELNAFFRSLRVLPRRVETGEEASEPRFPSQACEHYKETYEHIAALKALTCQGLTTRHRDPYTSSDVNFINQDGEIPSPSISN